MAGVVEWCLLLTLLAVVMLGFFHCNGFITSSDLQPYPY